MNTNISLKKCTCFILILALLVTSHSTAMAASKPTKVYTYTNDVISVDADSLLGVYGRDVITIKYIKGSKSLKSVNATQKVKALGSNMVIAHGSSVSMNAKKTKCTVKSTFSLNFSCFPKALAPVVRKFTPYLTPLVNLGTIAKVQTTYTITMVKGSPKVTKSTSITWVPGKKYLISASKEILKFLGIKY